MKKYLCLAILFVSSYLFGAGGSVDKYYYINSTGTKSISMTRTSTEIYIIKFSTPAAYVNYISSTMPLIAYPTNYFILPATDDGFVVEHMEEVNSSYMSIFSTYTGVTPNIIVKIKSW